MAGIYIHIPFCKKLCAYCDFYHIPAPEDNTPFIKALLKEAADRSGYLAKETVSTVYIGGGTPSVLSVSEILLILDRLNTLFSIAKDAEITVELNPDDVHKDYLSGIKKIGVNRISL
ncbi:MAG: radical SAM protein, partial [Bacteroidales bacterium]|nr:radical SAM protein [Bacteroidales bacterium]